VNARTLILAGYSNTGAKVRAYIEQAHRAYRLENGGPIYDGFFPGQTAVGTMPGPIGELDVPVIELQGEREIIATLARNPNGLTYRRPDGSNYRLYEVAGMAHVNTRGAVGPSAQCAIEHPSQFPLRAVWDAALDNLVQWIATGTAPPRVSRIDLDASGKTIRRDANGNAQGGLRTVYLDVPLATYRTVSENRPGTEGGRCDMRGEQHDFSPEKLRDLYGTPEQYRERFNARLDELLELGWYLDLHAPELREEARAVSF
ncbi:MAG: alpha/beta hydrolase domain-containing protein, partial [Gammaproteobacteria bacterium]